MRITINVNKDNLVSTKMCDDVLQEEYHKL